MIISLNTRAADTSPYDSASLHIFYEYVKFTVCISYNQIVRNAMKRYVASIRTYTR